jgi:hypothetical protein
LSLVGASARQACGATSRGEIQGFLDGEAGAQGEREAGREAVPAPVGIRDGAGDRRRGISTRPSVLGLVGSPFATFGPYHQARDHLQVSRAIGLRWIERASDERVEPNPSPSHVRQDPRRGHQHPGFACRPECARVARREVHRVGTGEVAPEQRVLPRGVQPLADRGDGALPVPIDEREATALGDRAKCGRHPDAKLLQSPRGLVPQPVGAQGREEGDAAGELRELDRSHPPAPSRDRPRLVCVNDVARTWDLLHTGELHPLDVSDHRDANQPFLTSRWASASSS